MFRALFRRRLHLPELAPGRVDVHCHLLPGVDDGAADEAAALAIIRAQQKAGFRGAICTPHIMARLAGNTPERLRETFERFCALADAEVPGFALHLAAEYMLDEQFERHLARPDKLLHWPAPQAADGSEAHGTSNASSPAPRPHLLVELPQYMLPDGWQDMLRHIRRAGFTPVLAHPERYYRVLEEAELAALHASGVRFQGNLGSLCGHYGPHARELATTLRVQKLYSWWGSDAHTADTLNQLPLSA